jgi:pseudaminic acid cytidylyltransferase
MRIAVIPARGGSKRIPRKNIRDFCGKPMLAWAINKAKDSGLFSHIIVSTDDYEIAQLAKDWGAEVPFIRPNSLSDDLTATVPVIAHAVKACMNMGWNIEHACCIYPCAPFLQMKDLRDSLDLAKSENADFVYPVTDYAHPIQRAMRQLPNGKMQFFQPEYELTGTQNLEKSFHDAGQFYWGKATAWLEQKKMHTDGFAIYIPNWRVVDIDYESDWQRAEIIFKAYFI